MARNAALADMSDDDLVAELNDAKEELFNLRFQHVTGQLDNYAAIKAARKNVARTMTELRAREIEKADALAAASVNTADATASEDNDE